jgi:hypothetical protein
MARIAASGPSGDPSQGGQAPGALEEGIDAGPARVRPRTSRLSQLPSESVREVGRFLCLSDLAALRAGSPARVQKDLKPLFRAAYINEVSAPSVSSLAEFRLQALRLMRLPGDVRARPLESLAVRVLTLPDHQHQAAIDSLLQVQTTEQASALLDDLRQTANEGPDAMRHREARLVLGGPAGAAVLAGGRVTDVAREFGIAGLHGLSHLDRIALVKASEWLLRGEATVPEAVARLGLAMPHPREAVEALALQLEGLPGVQRGESPASVALRLGLGHVESLSTLWAAGALYQVALGRRPREVIDELGIHPGLHESLREHSVNTAGRDALRAGSRLEDVATRLGVEPYSMHFLQLEVIAAQEAVPPVDELTRREADLAFSGPAAAAVRGGRTVLEVASKFRIMGWAALQHLESIATPRAIDWLQRGEATAPEAARRLGIVTDRGLQRVEEMALAVKGRYLIEAGQSAQEIAAQLGIERARPFLDTLAAVHQVREGRRCAELIREFGLDDEHQQVMLELSVDTVGRSALLSGARVGDVAARLGVENHPQRVERLERLAAELIGGHLVLNAGLTPEEAARRLDIRDPQRVRDAVVRIQAQPVGAALFPPG